MTETTPAKPPEHLLRRIVLMGPTTSWSEDGGQARIIEFGETEGRDHERLFVRVHSWDETKQHPELRGMEGRSVKITIEW